MKEVKKEPVMQRFNKHGQPSARQETIKMPTADAQIDAMLDQIWLGIAKQLLMYSFVVITVTTVIVGTTMIVA
jgi:hypothetical protein